MKKSLALLCLIGVSVHSVDAKVPNKVHLQLNNKQKEGPTNNENIEQQETDMNPKNDDISTSNTDDMFAFSQVIASGGNIKKTVEDLEKEEVNRVKAEKKAQEIQDWKYAMELQKPKIVIPKEVIEKENKAKAELTAMENNDATMALADLQVAQELELKAEQMRGSGEEPIDQKKIMLEEQKRQKVAFEKKKAAKKAAVEKKKKEALQKADHIEKQYQAMKTQHGGLTGVEDTGYDDSLMNAYIVKDSILPPSMASIANESDVQLHEEIEIDSDDDQLVYLNLLQDHRDHLLIQKIREES